MIHSLPVTSTMLAYNEPFR